jgi:hypothetical protein
MLPGASKTEVVPSSFKAKIGSRSMASVISSWLTLTLIEPVSQKRRSAVASINRGLVRLDLGIARHHAGRPSDWRRPRSRRS